MSCQTLPAPSALPVIPADLNYREVNTHPARREVSPPARWPTIARISAIVSLWCA
jgi:hypothetical protein